MTCTTIERPPAFQRAEDTGTGGLEERVDTTGRMAALGWTALRIIGACGLRRDERRSRV
ncbi:MAG TPA: hypothetical protein PK955_06785 [Methanoregulaceae archaeon]|nr:hypothetical protein [Methanoregulaceae archaeon]